MYLKRVKLFGFKSFADRTELEFNPHLIAIVGPNGCGKSNIVDAILWALGEHNPRVLRAGTASEVIFSGSARRKGLGYAEVQLTFDNDDGGLGFPAAEVATTRRVTLDGESEYFINGRSCRQKDIVDLFADTGLGRTGYGIVGQQELDSLLTALPEQRRLLIDEAAGVQKFRVRKADTLKRLEAANQHLRRAQDLVDEMERQLAPLEKQAALAHAYRAARARLDELELDLILRDLLKFTEQLAAIDEEVSNLASNAAQLDRRLQESEQAAAALGETIGEAEKELDHRRNLQQGAFTALERADNAVALAEERLRSLQQIIVSEEQRADSSSGEISRLRSELNESQQQLDATNKRLAELGDGALVLELQRTRGELEQAREQLTEIRRTEAARQREEVERRESVARIGRMRDEITELSRERYPLEASVADLADRLATSTGRVQDTEAERAKAETDLESVREARARISSDLADRQRELAAAEARRETLAAGTPGDVTTKLLEDKRLSRLAKRLTVKPEHRIAIDAALAAGGEALIAATGAIAREVMGLLTELQEGRAWIMSPETVRRSAGDALRTAARAAGALGLASDFVGCSSPDNEIVGALLGTTVICPDWPQALALADQLTGWDRIVTLAGETIESSGAWQAGPIRGRVAIESELRDLAEAIETMEAECETLSMSLAETDRKTEVAVAQKQALDRDASLRRTENAEAERNYVVASQRLEMLVKRSGDLESQIKELSEKMPTESAFEDLGDPDEIQQRVSDLEREVAARETSQTHHSKELRDLEAVAEGQSTRVARLKAQIAQAGDKDDQDRSRLFELAQKVERAEADVENGKNAAETAREAKLDADGKFEEARLARAALLEESFRAGELGKTLRQERGSLSDRAHGLDLDRAKADIKRSQILSTLAQDREIGAERALLMATKLEVPQDADREAAALRRQLRDMGEVNIGAVDALDELRDRHRDLVTQRDDLLDAKNQILAAMKEIEAATLERFLTTFDAVRQEFEIIMGRLFEGGQGEITLTDPNDLMASGVNIAAQLSGKRLQRMELLSGGERSLTALAFLFALLRVKPSPLCILDEVDAALDGRNVERFCDLLRDMASRVQFLVVTHNAVTIENSDVWYGVTMQEPGVSTVIPFGAGARAVVEAVV